MGSKLDIEWLSNMQSSSEMASFLQKDVVLGIAPIFHSGPTSHKDYSFKLQKIHESRYKNVGF